jgi:hypothetical protein
MEMSIDDMEMSSDSPIFTSVQQVLDFIGTEYGGGPCNAITALQVAMFHQQNPKNGMIFLSNKIGIELFGKELPSSLCIGVTKYTVIQEMLMFSFPARFERMLASALYMMKDPRKEFTFESTAVGASQSWGEITKLSILDNSADKHTIEFEYAPNRYTAYFFKKEGRFFFRICQSSEVVVRARTKK